MLRDGSRDCSDGSDEAGVSKRCGDKEFRCGNGACVPRRYVNDGIADCDTDEGVLDFPCHWDEFTCKESRQCVPYLRVGDTISDCLKGEDEGYIRRCFRGEFRCSNGLGCVALSRTCDGSQDCGDGSDETIACNEPSMYECGGPGNGSVSSSERTLLPWGYLLRDDIVSDEAQRLCKGNLTPLSSRLLMGFKCTVALSDDIYNSVEARRVSKLRRPVPQFYVKLGLLVCADGEDRCYDGDVRCFVCFDGTVIGRRQVQYERIFVRKRFG